MANINCMPPSLSELTPMKSNMGLTHLGSEASNYHVIDDLNVHRNFVEVF